MQEFTYNNEETSGFYICCAEFEECLAADWEELPKDSVTVPANPGTTILVDTAFATKCLPYQIRNLAYAWADTPAAKYLGLPVYSNDEYRLPGAPWNYAI